MGIPITTADKLGIKPCSTDKLGLLLLTRSIMTGGNTTKTEKIDVSLYTRLYPYFNGWGLFYNVLIILIIKPKKSPFLKFWVLLPHPLGNTK